MDTYQEILKLIAQSSFALLAIVGTFTVFKLQWFRKEIDDYRGRLIKVLARSRSTGKSILKSYTQGFDMPDDEFFKKAEDHLELENEEIFLDPKEDHSDKEDYSTYGETFSMLRKRMEEKVKIIEFITLTITLLSFVFVGSLVLLIVNINPSCNYIINSILLIIIVIIVYYIIITKLIENLKEY